jgi:hypothetical protein
VGFWGKLGDIAGTIGASFIPGGSLAKDAIKAGIGAAGAGLSGASEASASNRGSQLEAALAAEQINQLRQQQFQAALMAREEAQRSGMKDSMRAMQQADYVINRHPGDYKPASIMSQGQQRQLPSFGFGYRAPGPGETEAAYAVADQARQRLLNGGTLTPAPIDRGDFQFDPKLLKGSSWEKLAGLLGVGLTAAGSITGRDKGGK